MNIKKTLIGIVAASAVGSTLISGAVFAGHRDGGGMDFDDGDFNLLGMSSFETMDVNGDGNITQDEIDSLRAEHLARHDSNGDGELNLEEFLGLWHEAIRPVAVRAFQSFDRDGDGTITKVEYDRPMEGVINRFDNNNDGELSLREFRWQDDDDDDDGFRWGNRNSRN